MARIRSIKPEVRRSRTVTEWSRDVQLTWVYLWCYLDDDGRGEDDLGLIKAELYPRSKDVTEKRLDDWLWAIASKRADKPVPPLCRYTVDGMDYLHATNWNEHQKISHPKESAIQPCPVHELRISGIVRSKHGPMTVEFGRDSGGAPE